MISGIASYRGVLPALLMAAWVFSAVNGCAQATNIFDAPLRLQLDATEPSVQPNGIGRGFARETSNVSLSAVGGVGFKVFGSKADHDVALLSLAYGHMLGGTVGEDRWYRGNWELRVEVFGGLQFYPETEYIIGLAPHIRYNFATGSRWVPFVDVGGGVAWTGIGEPDLGGDFQFNEQFTAGLHHFLKENLALTAEMRFMHLSNAGIHAPNNGVNLVMGFIGLSWFF